ncbi:unnamed protein product [Symbiodinium sp. KB8]|nr:unnamed protein product [Symbiodinium sp. KB8]
MIITASEQCQLRRMNAQCWDEPEEQSVKAIEEMMKRGLYSLRKLKDRADVAPLLQKLHFIIACAEAETRKCCSRDCLKTFQHEHRLARVHKRLENHSEEEKNRFLLSLMQMCPQDANGKLQYQLLGQRVCIKAFSRFLSVNKKRVERLLVAVGSGLLPPDLRQSRHLLTPEHVAPRSASVDAYLHHLYVNAEPLAETELDQNSYLSGLYICASEELNDAESDHVRGLWDNRELREALFIEDEPTVLAAADTRPGGLKRDVRVIQHQSYESMYANYLIFTQKSPEEEVASCTACSMFTVRRALTESERAPLFKAQEVHISEVMAHRKICQRLNTLSEEGTRPGLQDCSGAVLKVDLDGADQAKTLLPRNCLDLTKSKGFCNLWRPHVHVIGCIIHGVTWLYHWTGVVEVFWLLQPDVAGDSSTETTVLLKSLEVAEEILNGRKTEVPKHLVLEVVVLNTSSNIKDWVDSLPINISGLVPNPRQADGKGMDVCHAWRIARREEI